MSAFSLMVKLTDRRQAQASAAGLQFTMLVVKLKLANRLLLRVLSEANLPVMWSTKRLLADIEQLFLKLKEPRLLPADTNFLSIRRMSFPKALFFGDI